MSLWKQIASGVRALAGRTRADRDVADEVAHFLAEAAAERQSDGLSADEARRATRLAAGSALALEEQVRSARWEASVDTVWADIRYGARRLGRKPAATALAVLTLGLGIGASTAIFSAANPVLFEPLPYPDADRLVMIWDGQHGTPNAAPERAAGTGQRDVTFGTYREVMQRSRSLISAAVIRPTQATFTSGGEPERLDGQYVSADYFRVLGVSPAHGRDFLPSDDRPRAPFVVILSDALWRRHFGGDPGVVGRQIRISDTPVTVIGVMPASFESVLSPTAEFWSALEYDPTLPLNGREWGHHLRMIGRLRAGTAPAQADLELDTIARTPVAALRRAPWADLRDGFVVAALQEDLTRGVRPAMMAILGAVIVLLAIACVNVTNLLLSSAFERRGEIAMRAALGASRGRIVRQLLIESILLTVLGGLFGVALAFASVDAVVAMSPSELPRAGTIGVDGQALAFALGLTMLIGVAIGLVPALQGTRRRSGQAWHTAARVTHGYHLARRALVVVQIGLAIVLLVGAGLLVRSLQRLFAVPAGFDAQQVLTMQVAISGQRYLDAGASHRFFDEALAAVRNVPGVEAAAFSSLLPLTGVQDVWGFTFESSPTQTSEENRDVHRYAVSPGYLEAMRIPLRQGRRLNAGDAARAPLVAVVNESLVRRRLPGIDPIGQRLRVGPLGWFTVVGVVADVKQTSLAMDGLDAVYITSAQWTQFADITRWLVVRTRGDAEAMTPAIRSAIASVDRNQPIMRVATMDERLRASVARQRFALVLFQAFGIAALVLAAIGTYGLLSGMVADRTREIGVRAALGATRSAIVRLVLRQGLWLAAVGIVLGAAGGLLSSRALTTLLFGISESDPITYLAVAMLMLVVSAVACGIPASRAACVMPSIALRAE